MKIKSGSVSRGRWAVSLCIVAVSVVACLACVGAQRGGASSQTNRTTPRTVTLGANADLQKAIDDAQPGDTILLPAGAMYRGVYNLPNKGASEAFITIRSAAPDAQLPAANERLDPSRYAALLPAIASNKKDTAALTATNGAHHYRFIAVRFAASPDGGGNIVSLGTGAEKSRAALPHHIEFDRTYFHGDPTVGQRRGIALNGRDIRIVNSHFADFKRQGEESQAIAGWNGTGNFEIINNYIEAAAEGVLFGGAESPLKTVPSDILVRGNTFNKPLKWRKESWLIKNHFELKNAQRVIIDGNLMTNNWAKGQDGSAVLFTVRDEDGKDSQATVSEVFFINNIVRGSGSAFNIYGSEGRGGHRLTIANNLFEDIDGGKWGGSGGFLKITEWDKVEIENNTILTTGSITFAYGKPVTGFIFRNNIIPHNEYGFIGDGHGSGADTLDTYFPGSIIANNAIIGGDASKFKGRNAYPVSLKQMRFINPANGDYRLAPDNPLKRAGAGGKTIGVDFEQRVTVKF